VRRCTRADIGKHLALTGSVAIGLMGISPPASVPRSRHLLGLFSLHNRRSKNLICSPFSSHNDRGSGTEDIHEASILLERLSSYTCSIPLALTRIPHQLFEWCGLLIEATSATGHQNARPCTLHLDQQSSALIYSSVSFTFL
jgi:hypothetical protein